MSDHEAINKRSWEVVKDLEPKTFWKYFYDLSRIPRESKKEEKCSAWLVQVGKDFGVEVFTDKAMNVLYRVPATKGCENVPMVTLQAHMDMVAEKLKGKVHNFDTDPIELVRENEDWICASQTTLGADNGVGLCVSLALVHHQNDFKHGPFECLFTTDEEMGMGGVEGMEFKWFSGKYLLNMDSEDWGEIFTGCAGGADSVVTAQIETEACELGKAWEFEVGGLLGGHSGCDINQERCNANKFLAKLLYRLVEKKVEFCLVDYRVDSKFNAIPRSGSMVLRFTEESKAAVEAEMKNQVEETVREFGSVGDDKVWCKMTESQTAYARCWKTEFMHRFVKMMHAMPHGVHRTSHDLAGQIVETSNNLANAYIVDGRIDIGLCSRSFNTVALKDMMDKIACVAELAGFVSQRQKPYPGWKPVPGSKITQICKEVFMKKFPDEGEPKVLGIHAGLECGFLLAKNPEMECVSIGPTITNAHTPRENMQISTNIKFWDYILAIMEEFTKREW